MIVCTCCTVLYSYSMSHQQRAVSISLIFLMTEKEPNSYLSTIFFLYSSASAKVRSSKGILAVKHASCRIPHGIHLWVCMPINLRTPIMNKMPPESRSMDPKRDMSYCRAVRFKLCRNRTLHWHHGMRSPARNVKLDRAEVV